MRPTVSTAETSETEFSVKEFGTGLRARLDVVRAVAVEQAEKAEQAERARPLPRRDVSPELVLVSPDPEPEYAGSLAEALLDHVREARREPLGALLAEAGLLAPGEIDFALTRAEESGRRLGEVLVAHGLVSPSDIVRLVAQQRGLPFLDVRTLAVDPAAAKLLPGDLARLFRTLPVGFVRGLPVVAVADPTDDQAMHGARSVLHTVRFIASPEDSILAQLARVYVG
jgi:type II secretion system (T2SS) protein E